MNKKEIFNDIVQKYLTWYKDEANRIVDRNDQDVTDWLNKSIESINRILKDRANYTFLYGEVKERKPRFRVDGISLEVTNSPFDFSKTVTDYYYLFAIEKSTNFDFVEPHWEKNYTINHNAIIAAVFFEYRKYLELKLLEINEVEQEGLSLAQIALLYFYQGKKITRNNANNIAKKYGWTSGINLSSHYRKYTNSRANRTGEGKYTKTNLEKIIPYLTDKESIRKAEDDLELARKNNF